MEKMDEMTVNKTKGLQVTLEGIGQCKAGRNWQGNGGFGSYEWSRSSGYCGEPDAASEGFEEVMELSKGSPEAQRLRTPALSELARLYFDNQRYAESLEFFEEAAPSLEALGVKKDDPIGYCLF
jgi:hypothetical protein